MESKTTTRTIRLERGLETELARASESEGISVNLLVNKAILKMVEWDIQANKFGFASIPAAMLEKLLQYLSEEQAREIGGWAGRNMAGSMMTFWFKQLDLDNGLKALEWLGPKYGRNFSYRHSPTGNSHTVIIHHGMGRKASIFYEEVLQALFGELLKAKVTVDSSDIQVVALVSPSDHAEKVPLLTKAR